MEQYFITDHVYEIDPTDGSLDYQVKSDNVRPTEEVKLGSPIQCDGLGKLALAVLAHYVDEKGVSSLDMLVVDQANGESLLATSQMVSQYPDMYLSPSLARKIVTLDKPELDQLDIPKSITDEIALRYPNLKPYDKNYR